MNEKTVKYIYRAFMLILAVVLLIMGVDIEMKLNRLSSVAPVVVYENAETSQTDAFSDYSEDTDEHTTEVSTSATAQTVTESTVSEESQSFVDSSGYYVTASGKKYHIGSCSYLSKSRIKVTTEEILSGGYEPCSRCIK